MLNDDHQRHADERTFRSLALVGWVVLLILVVGGLHTLGRGPLAAPPVIRPGAVAAWLDQRSPPTVAFGALRLAAMGLAGYLLAVTLAGLVARVVGRARWSAVMDAISPLLVRRLVQGAAGLTVATTVTTTQAAAWATPGVPAGSASPTPIMRRLPSYPPSTSATVAPPISTASPPAPRVAPGRGAGDGAPRPPPATSPPATAPAATAPPATAPPATAPPTPPPSTTAPPASLPAPRPTAVPATWVIRPGDNLWSVAEATLVRAWGRAASDAEVDDYWTGLIAVNRVRLAHGDDPDLVFPGQVFELPAPPPPSQP